MKRRSSGRGTAPAVPRLCRANFAQSVSRAAITAAYRRPETEAVSMLLEQARLPQPVAEQARKLAINWPINCVIKKMPVVAQVWSGAMLRVFAVIAGRRGADVSGGSVVRIPDKATRDALIRDKISNGNWQSHIGRQPVTVC